MEPALSPPTVRSLLAAAAAAPSMHNAQPWRFGVRGDAIEVHADPDRELRVGDPHTRALHIGCGAAVFNLRLAVAAELGREPVVRLLPDRAASTHLATVRVAGPRPATPAERVLHAAIPARHTNRWPFADVPVAAEVLTALVEAAAIEGAQLSLPDEQETARLLELVRDVQREQSVDPAYVEELARWTATDPATGEGVPLGAAGPRDAERALPLRDFAATVRTRERVAFERRPRLAVLSTVHDVPADWLRAGQALQRVLLVATTHGLAASFLNQAVESDEDRWLVRDPQGGPAHPHMVLRVGHPTAAATATPRRPVDALLEPRDLTDR